MRAKLGEKISKDFNFQFQGEENTRLNSLTDAVFGIALALLIFNVSDANSFADLVVFAKSFPAIIVSIVLLYIIWKEHVSFTALFGIQGFSLQFLNVLFIALVIFYVYPLRFLTKLLTNMLFNLEIELNIQGNEIPHLMIYYGAIAFAIYFTLYLFYATVLKQNLGLNQYEIFHTREHKKRMLVMASVPFISLSISIALKNYSILWSSILGGMAYGLYPIFITVWHKKFDRKKSIL